MINVRYLCPDDQHVEGDQYIFKPRDGPSSQTSSIHIPLSSTLSTNPFPSEPLGASPVIGFVVHAPMAHIQYVRSPVL